MGDDNTCNSLHEAGMVDVVDVAVVGAGVSGLCAVKHCLQQGLRVVALEKAGCAGGLWRPGGAPWQSLRTNLSRYTCAFSDFDWPEDAPLFPTASELFDFIQSYAQKFGLLEHVRCGCEVVSACVHPADGNSWTVTYRDSAGHSRTLRARFLTVCSGFFASPVIPDSIRRSEFAGRMMHSEEYSTPDSFAGKRVLVVGNSFSGADICAELTSTAAEVHNAVRGSKWIFGREIRQEPFSRPLPVDLLFYSRQSVARKRTVPVAERNEGTNAWFEGLLGLPSAVHPLLTSPSGPAPAAVSITDRYLAMVSAGRIQLHRPLAKLEGHRAVFSDETAVEVDEVIFATGYRPDLRFLLQRQEQHGGDGGSGVKTIDLCDILEYRPDDMLLPVILHLHTLHPALPTLGFVGMYKGPYFAVMELQARWLASLFSGAVLFPSEQEFADGLRAMREIRDSEQRPQFAADYAVMAESIAEHLRVGPGSAVADPRHELHELLFAGPLLPAHYRMTPDQATTDEHVPPVIKEVRDLLKSSR